jgi:hypothetical protein
MISYSREAGRAGLQGRETGEVTGIAGRSAIQ